MQQPPCMLRRINQAKGSTMAATLMHFHNLLLGLPACLPVNVYRERLESTCDPARVTCLACLAYLGHQQRVLENGASLVTSKLLGSTEDWP